MEEKLKNKEFAAIDGRFLKGYPQLLWITLCEPKLKNYRAEMIEKIDFPQVVRANDFLI